VTEGQEATEPETSTEAPAQNTTPPEYATTYVQEGTETSEEAPVLAEIVDSTTELPETLTAAEAAQVLGVSARRVRQFVQEHRLDVARNKPLAITAASVERLAQERNTSGTVAVHSASTGLQNLGVIVEILRSEHATTLAALEARVSDVVAHRDALTEQVQDLRNALDVERARVEELSAKVQRMTHRKWWQRG
jgi:plasmid maintenance system antidote protein VapI